MRLATRHGLPRPTLMRFTLKLLANLTDPRRRRRHGPADQRAVQGRSGGLSERHYYDRPVRTSTDE